MVYLIEFCSLDVLKALLGCIMCGGINGGICHACALALFSLLWYQAPDPEQPEPDKLESRCTRGPVGREACRHHRRKCFEVLLMMLSTSLLMLLLLLLSLSVSFS